MKGDPRCFRLGATAPAEDAYVLIDRSGQALNVSIWRREGERLPPLAVAGANPAGYVRVGEIAAKAA
jgi:hypothetical protein